MKIRNEYGKDVLVISEDKVCRIAGRPLREVSKCPIQNFDTEGEICVPSKCDKYGVKESESK